LQTLNGSDDKACLEREIETPPVIRQQMAVDAVICRDEFAGLRIERPPRRCS